jgi:VanZ family protein
MTAGGDPDPQHAEVRRATRWLALCVLLVTLGSLYPWHFAWPSSLSAAWTHMINQRSWWTGPRDVVGNVVLFVPLGVLGWAVLRPSRWPMLLAAALVVGVGVAFAFALQVAQIFVPRRDAAWSDVVWNTLGLLAGLLLAKPMLRLPMARWRFMKRHSRCRGKAR